MIARLLRAEWTKLRSTRTRAWCLLIGAALTIGLDVALAAANRKGAAEPAYGDRFSFVHQPMAGDGSIVARLAEQADSQQWAKAGLIVKAGTGSGTPYAAVMVTPHHGVRFETGFHTDVAGSPGRAPRWLRLTRSGDSVTGYESADGTAWTEVARTSVAGLPATVEVGLFVTSPVDLRPVQGGGRSSFELVFTEGRAVFDHVTVGSTESWQHLDVAPTPQPGEPTPRTPGGYTVSGGTFTVTGAGDIVGYGIPSRYAGADRDTVVDSLRGVQLSLIAAVALGVLFMTAEYRTGLVRMTFAATPRRGRVLAAKAVVLGGAVFAAGLPAVATAFLLAQPVMRRNGFVPPAYPSLSFADPPVLRAIAGTALFLAVLAVFSLAVATVVRRAAVAIPLVIALVLVPQIVSGWLSLDAATWLGRLTPAAGLAIQQTVDRYDTAIGPWAGLGVLGGYAAAALGLAYWRLRRSDA